MSEQSDPGNSKAKDKKTSDESPLLQHHDSVDENWLDGIGPSSNAMDLTNYVSRKCDEYVSMKSTDEDLYELFQLDFQKWDSATFDKVRLPILLRFRKLLREHGIYISKTNIPCSGAIVEALQSPYREWTESEVGEIAKDKAFTCVSGKLQYLESRFDAQILSPNKGMFAVSPSLETPLNIDTPGPKQLGWPNSEQKQSIPIIPEITDVNPPDTQIDNNNPASPPASNSHKLVNSIGKFFRNITPTIGQIVSSEVGLSEELETYESHL